MNTPIYQANFQIETDRLIIRSVSINDKHALFVNIFHDHDVLKYYVSDYIEDEASFNLEAYLTRYNQNEFLFLAIVLKETGEVIGIIHQCNRVTKVYPNIELGYAIGKQYWNHGYTTEATKALINYLLTKPVHKIIISHIKENIASKRVIEKCGLKYEYTIIEGIYYHQQYYDLCYYSLINQNY